MISTSYDYTQGGSGFTYDASVVDFSTGVAKLLDRRPSNATFFAAWSSQLNGNWSGAGNGSLVVTAGGSAAISGGALDLTGNSGKYVTWVATGNCDALQAGTIELQVIPNYSGSPGADQFFVAIARANGNHTNLIQLTHATANGHLILRIEDGAAAAILDDIDLGAWSPVSGTTYTLLLQYDVTNGATKLFINGVQKGATQPGTGTRSGAVAFAGIGVDVNSDAGSNFKVVNFSAYSAVVTPASPSLASTPFATNDPTVAPNAALSMDQMTAFSVISQASGSDAVKWAIKVAGVLNWFNGSAWTTSNGAAAEANDAATIAANVATLPISSGAFVFPVAIFHSAGGTTTPTLSSLALIYNYFGQPPVGPSSCLLWGYLKDPTDAPLVGATVQVKNDAYFVNQGILFAPGTYQAVTNSLGYFEISLAETVTPNLRYSFFIKSPDGKTLSALGSALVPNQINQNIASMAFTS